MAVSIVVREYNPTTGNLIGNINALQFGNVNIGEVSPVKVIDLVVPEVSFISNVRLVISSSDLLVVNDSPVDIGADGSSGNGNFGIETSEQFISRNTLSRFFAGTNEEVEVGTKGDNVSKYTYLNVKMDTDQTGKGTVVYKWLFDFS
jgi:hypothetical protein